MMFVEVGWKGSVAKWLDGRIQDVEPYSDVENWLLTDPLWKGYVFEQKVGSHEYFVRIPLIQHYCPKWQKDTMTVSKYKGQYCKDWIVEQLVKAYKELERDSENKK